MRELQDGVPHEDVCRLYCRFSCEAVAYIHAHTFACSKNAPSRTLRLERLFIGARREKEREIFFPRGHPLIVRGTAGPGAGGPSLLCRRRSPFRNSRVSADLSSLLSQSTGRCTSEVGRGRMHTYALVRPSATCTTGRSRESIERARRRERTVTRVFPRAFVFIMAPIYPLMTTRERIADMTARRSYDVSGGPLVIVRAAIQLLIYGC